MATELEAAVANELGFHIDDLQGDAVTDAEDRSMGTTYEDTTLQRDPGAGMYEPNQFAIVLQNGVRLRVTVETEL